MMEDWTEKYRPKTLRDVAGNDRAISSLRAWAEHWNRGKTPAKRAVILSGKPGTGKTSCALALAHDLHWTVLELNASDARNETTIRRVATAGAINETLDTQGRYTPAKKGGRKLIILDEADNLYEKTEQGDSGVLGDKGGKKAIVDTIRITKQPIVLIVNNYYELIRGGGEPLKQHCTLISFYEVPSSQIVELLKRICVEEHITVDVTVLRTLADRSKGDVRSAVNDLQSLCLNKSKLGADDLDVLGYRDRETLIFDALREVFKTKSLPRSRNCLESVDVDPEMFLLWVTENLPKEYLDTDDLVQGYEAASKADVMFGRVRRNRAYELWSYACDLMSGGVSVARTHMYGNTHYGFPLWLKKMKKTSSSSRYIRENVVRKISTLCHASERKTKETTLPHFQELFRSNSRFACKMIKKLEFTESEVTFLLGPKHQHRMQDILQCSERDDEKQAEIQPLADEKKTKRDKEEPSEMKQPSLFDFSVIF